MVSGGLTHSAFYMSTTARGGLTLLLFPGPYPRLKFDTLIERLSRGKIQPSLLFFRTSAASRASPRFLNESNIIPPLLYMACVHTLQELALSVEHLEVHFADEEADPYVVEFAGRVGAYAVGQDSDYVVLNTDGYLGYIPLNEMVWNAADAERVSELGSEDDGEFQLVKRSKANENAVSNSIFRKGIIPPDAASGLTLSVEFFSPSSLASRLNLPVSLLPLLGAFVGNDFSKSSTSLDRSAQSRFFERHLTFSQRIDHVASTLRSILSSSSQKRKQKQVGSVMDLIDKTVSTLLHRSTSSIGSGEMKEIVDKIVEATLQYAITKADGRSEQHELRSTEICVLHEPDVCPILPFISRRIADVAAFVGEESEEVEQRDMVRRLYLAAYRRGELSPQIMDVLSTGTYWPKFFLESPDLETVSLSIGCNIRQWGYSILEDAVGLPNPEIESKDAEVTGQSEGEDEDELIDVVESSEDDPPAPLRGEMDCHVSEDEATEPPESTSSHSQSIQTPRPKIVTEYIRRGIRVSPTEVVVPPLADLLSSIPGFDTESLTPLQLRSEEERLRVLLCAAKSDTPLVKALPCEQLAVVLALRWVLHVLNARAKESGGNKMKEKERWTKHEAQSFLASFSWSKSEESVPQTTTAIPVEDRNIQLMAQVLMAMKSIEHLSQILLLSDRVRTPIYQFSGKTCHSYWTGVKPLNAEAVSPGLWNAFLCDLEDGVFTEPKQKSIKKKKKEMVVPATKKGVTTTGKRGGLFGVLESIEA